MGCRYWDRTCAEIKGMFNRWKSDIDNPANPKINKAGSKGSSSSASASSFSQQHSVSASSKGGSSGGIRGRPPSVPAAGAHYRQGKAWAAQELAKLSKLVQSMGTQQWANVAKALGTGRTARAVMERWVDTNSGGTSPAAKGGAKQEASSPESGLLEWEAYEQEQAAAAYYARREQQQAASRTTQAQRGKINGEFLADEACLKPLEDVWHSATTMEGCVYYVSQTTGKSTWTPPSEDVLDVVTKEERAVWQATYYNYMTAGDDDDDDDEYLEEEVEDEMLSLTLPGAPANGDMLPGGMKPRASPALLYHPAGLADEEDEDAPPSEKGGGGGTDPNGFVERGQEELMVKEEEMEDDGEDDNILLNTAVNMRETLL